jgi:4'-phosphopantetheinyl transferase
MLGKATKSTADADRTRRQRGWLQAGTMWRTEPKQQPLPAADEVHVWTVQLPAATPVDESVLSADEQERAGRFHFAADQTRYRATQVILRRMLADYLGVEPAKLAFTRDSSGKPHLVLSPEQPPLTFNLSHSGGVLLYGVALARRVGVDVEAIRTNFDLMELARGQFAPAEVDKLASVPEAARGPAFFACWTRKEAYLKARGEGLGFPLNKFAVTLGPDEEPAVSWLEGDPDVTRRWSVFDLSGIPGCRAAVVVEGRPVRLSQKNWE